MYIVHTLLLPSTDSEALEASVIVSIILKFLDKIGKPELKRDVWLGTLAGFVCALAVGIGFVSAYYTLNKRVFVGKTEQLFEGFVMLFASIVIAILAVGMLQVRRTHPIVQPAAIQWFSTSRTIADCLRLLSPSRADQQI